MVSRIAVGMQCFWGAEAHFGWIPGVLTTRVGYGGGSTPSPTYRSIADHIEIVDVEFDTSQITLSQILKHFFSHHDPTEKHKRQYESAVLFRDSAQGDQIREFIAKDVPGDIVTGVYPLTEFHEAENYHQKYFLRKNKKLYDFLKFNDRKLIDSPIAAKLNAFSAGFGTLTQLEDYLVKNNLVIPKEPLEYMKSEIRFGPKLLECGI